MNKTYLLMDSRRLEEWDSLDLNLKHVVQYVIDAWPVAHLYVTSIDRTDQENTDAGAKTKIHVVGGRAIDLRTKNIGPGCTRFVLTLAKRINRRFRYDPKRPRFKVAYARAHGSGPHLHLQIHPRSEIV